MWGCTAQWDNGELRLPFNISRSWLVSRLGTTLAPILVSAPAHGNFVQCSFLIHIMSSDPKTSE